MVVAGEKNNRIRHAFGVFPNGAAVNGR